MNDIDIVYPIYNRLEFTQVTWRCLMENTDWGLVRKLRVFDDGSEDGTREWVEAQLADSPVPWTFTYLGYHSPVQTMIHYTNGDDAAPLFAKVDNDIAMPDGWLNALASVMNFHEDLELLGVQYGFGQDAPTNGARPDYGYIDAAHIGGVGLMRTSAFTSREQMNAAGRFGFTGWQYRHEPKRGWLSPSLLCPQLDLIPDEPFTNWSSRYLMNDWQRRWPPYDRDMSHLWDWVRT